MTEYHNWPNLKLTFLTNLGVRDYWGLPVQNLYEVRVVCKRSAQALNVQVDLVRDSIRERFPHAVDISLVRIDWLEKPKGRPAFGGGSDAVQVDFPF